MILPPSGDSVEIPSEASLGIQCTGVLALTPVSASCTKIVTLLQFFGLHFPFCGMGQWQRAPPKGHLRGLREAAGIMQSQEQVCLDNTIMVMTSNTDTSC